MKSVSKILAGILILLLGWQLGILHERSSRRFGPGVPNTMLIGPGAGSGMTVADPRRDVDMSLLWDTWEALLGHYIEPQKLHVTPLVYGAAKGLVSGVGDPYTVFMTPQEQQEFSDSLKGDLEGIGAELMVEGQGIVVSNPLKGSPAQKAGLLPKDIITHVDGQATDGWTLAQVVRAIRGPKGTTVKLGIFRDDEHLDIDITRAAIHIPSVESHIVKTSGKTIGYVALNQFGETSISELKQELQEFQIQRVHGVLLDLRNNGGGFLDGAVALVSIFLDEGDVVTVVRRQGPREKLTVSGRPMLPSIPLVILQNEATASASEIVTGALQDHDRATIIGKKSFGKGTVQEIIDLSGGSSLRVTVAKWLTPSGRDLAQEGVMPDIEVENPTVPLPPGDAWNWTADPQVKTGVETLLKK